MHRGPGLGFGGGRGTAGILYCFHRAMVGLLERILQEAGGSTVREMPGLLAGTFERPADVAVLALDGDGQHLVVDVAVVEAMTTSMVDRGRASWEAGFPARSVERGKRDRYQSRVEGAGHRFVPFVIECGGRLGQQAVALLEEMATRRADRYRRRDDYGVPQAEVRRRVLSDWLERLSTGIHAEMATWIELSLARAQQARSAPVAGRPLGTRPLP
jgi:hypothetical protein